MIKNIIFLNSVLAHLYQENITHRRAACFYGHVPVCSWGWRLTMMAAKNGNDAYMQVNTFV